MINDKNILTNDKGIKFKSIIFCLSLSSLVSIILLIIFNMENLSIPNGTTFFVEGLFNENSFKKIISISNKNNFPINHKFFLKILKFFFYSIEKKEKF